MAKTDFLPWPQGRAPDPAQSGKVNRANILATYGLDALVDDPELVQITQFVSQLCEAPVCLVNLIDGERQRFLSREGIEEREIVGIPSFCEYAMHEVEPMVVTDATADQRFAANPNVTGEAHIRFYAGAPLISHEGAPLGSLCVLDTKARPEGLTKLQTDGLTVMAASVMRRLRHRREALVQEEEREYAASRLQQMTEHMSEIVFAIETTGEYTYYNSKWTQYTGAPEPIDAEAWRPFIHPEDVDETYSKWDNCLKDGIAFEHEFRLKTVDEDWCWFLARTAPSDEGGPAPHRWFGTLTDIDDTHRMAESKDLLARELSHRIKNIFAVICGLIVLRTRNRSELTEFGQDLASTIGALGRAHDFVRPIDSAKGESLHGLLGVLMAPYGEHDETKLVIDGDDIAISVRAATPLALVFHELATNSAKYGALSADDGKVTVSVHRIDDEIVIDWNEEGGPPVVETDRQGFGSRLIRMAVQSQLRGTLNRDMLKKGMKATLRIPESAIV